MVYRVYSLYRDKIYSTGIALLVIQVINTDIVVIPVLLDSTTTSIIGFTDITGIIFASAKRRFLDG